MIKLIRNTAKKVKRLLDNYLLGSMRTKLLAAFLIIILIPMIIVTVYSISSMTGRAEVQMQAKLRSNSVAAGLMLESEITKYEVMSQNISNDNSLKMPLKFNLGFQITTYCEDMKGKKKDLDVLAVYKPDGTSIYASSNEYDDFAKKVLSSPKTVTGIILNKGLNIVSASPVLGDKDTLIGIILISHKMNEDKNMITKMSSKINTNVLLYQGSSLIMMSDNQNNVKIPNSSQDKNLHFKEALKKDDFSSSSTVNLFKNSYFISYKAIKDIDGKVVGLLGVAETDAELTRSVVSTFVVMIIIFLFSLAFTLAAAMVASRLFTKPINELMSLMKKVEGGDLTVSSKNKSKDEIGQLSSSFNKMIEELRNIVNTITERATEITGVSDALATISEVIVKDMDNIIGTMHEVMNGAENNSAAIEETTAGVQEISAKAYLIATESKNTEKVSCDAIEISESGKEAAEDARQSITLLMNELQSTSGSIMELELTTQKIFDIIKAINYIEGETNLLALNASIEAAKAGAAGKGFAVVADEIKKLSAETKRQVSKVKDLTNEINTVTKRVVSEMNRSLEQSISEVEKVNYVEKVILQVVHSISDVGEAIKKIAEASSSQAVATEQITSAIEGVAGTTVETATSSANVVETINEEFKSLQRLRGFVEELNGMSNGFKATINKFKTS
ncbi:MAG: methyl-accepting chemotaxis protein [Clostridia bacterium]|nr:methyl-accepting chemotaxis protein [Clostridia bacterium]